MCKRCREGRRGVRNGLDRGRGVGNGLDKEHVDGMVDDRVVGGWLLVALLLREWVVGSIPSPSSLLVTSLVRENKSLHNLGACIL